MHPTVSRAGDFVDNCLKVLSGKKRHPRNDEDDYDYDDYDGEGDGIEYYHSSPNHHFSNG